MPRRFSFPLSYRVHGREKEKFEKHISTLEEEEREGVEDFARTGRREMVGRTRRRHFGSCATEASPLRLPAADTATPPSLPRSFRLPRTPSAGSRALRRGQSQHTTPLQGFRGQAAEMATSCPCIRFHCAS